RLAGGDLPFRAVGRHIRTDPRPMHAAVDRLMQVLRAVVYDFRIVRVDLDWRLAHEPEMHVLRVLAVSLLWVDPIVLLLAGFHVVAAELAFAVAINDLAVGRRANLSALAA